MTQRGMAFEAPILPGGQIANPTMYLFEIYAAVNIIAATRGTPLLQVGERTYAKLILIRAVTGTTSLIDGVKLALMSMDSTPRSNLSRGMPLDLQVYRNNSVDSVEMHRIERGDARFRMVDECRSAALSEANRRMPAPDWPKHDTS